MAIPLIGPDGREYEIDDPAKVDAALKLGYRVVTPEAPQTLGEQTEALARDAGDLLDTGIEGATQGVTGGLYGAALGRGKDANESPEDFARRQVEVTEFKKRKEESPYVHGAGELAGMVLSPLGKVGPGIAGKLGATTALGRVGTAAVGQGVEGMLFGAGNTLSDAALNDHDLTAEQLAAGVGMGGLLGFGGGGLGQGLAEGFKAIGPAALRTIGKAVPGLEEFATNRALKAAGAAKRDLDYLGEDRAREVGQMLLQRGHLGQGAQAPNAAGVLKAIQGDLESTGLQLGKVFDDLHASGAAPDFASVVKKLDDFEAGLAPLERKEIAAAVKETREALAEYAAKPVTDPTAGFKGLNELKQNLQAKAKWSKANPEQAFGAGLKRQLSGVVREALDTQLVARLGPEAGAQFTTAKKLYGLLSDAERIAEHGAEKLGGNASFGLRDLGIGAAAGLGHGNPVAGMVGAVASKVLRERGQGVIARLAAEVSASPRLNVAAASFGKQLPAVAPYLGGYAAALTQAFARSPAVGLATHMTMAQVDPAYAAAAERAGFLPETPEENAAAMNKAGALAAVAWTVDRHSQALTTALEAVLKGSRAAHSPSAVMGSQDFGAKRMRQKDAREAHQKRVNEIREMAANPEALLERVAKNAEGVAELAPGVVAAMTRTASTAVAYLASISQHPPKAGPLATGWVPTDAERFRFTQALETVQDPMSVLKHAAAGTLTEEQVRALKAVYPRLAMQVQEKALEMLTTANPDAVSYRARLMLTLLTGVDADGTLSPEAVARNQLAIHANDSSTGAPQPPGERKSEQTLAQRTALPNQQRELES